MSIKERSSDELKTESLLKLAQLVLADAGKALAFKELYDEVSKLKGYSKTEKDDRIAQFYTELNVDGRFMTTGENVWGLKEWYPVEQADEEITAPPKKKRKKKKEAEDEDLDDLELEDDLELIELGEEELEEDEEDLEDFKPIEEDLDVEEEDLEEEISDEAELEDEDEKY